VPLSLDQRESVFVVFRRTDSAPSRMLPDTVSTTLAIVNGPWDISFPPNLGAPEKIQLADLESWTVSEDEGVKYFSGTATYTKTVQAPQSWFRPGAKILLDLGIVGDIAEVSVNGKAMGILWKSPYRVNVTETLKPGENQLEIKVTNQWTNRQTGDRIVAPDKRVFEGGSSGRRGGGFFNRPMPLAESGLIGPVKVISEVIQEN
jgi:hypothetical protein